MGALLQFISHRLGRALAWLAAVIVMVAAAFACGLREGKARCTAEQALSDLQATQAAVQRAQAKTRSGIARSTATGEARERALVAVDHYYERLKQEAADDDAKDDAACVLSAERLRRWNAANAGPGASASAPAGQPDHGAARTSKAEQRLDAGSGAEPPEGDPGLSPPGESTVPVDRLRADTP